MSASDSQAQTGAVLVCAECSKRSELSARGWRAFLAVDDQVASYCPECAEREFGDDA